MARSPSSPHPPGAGAALGGLRPLAAAHPRKACGRPPPSAPSAPPRPVTHSLGAPHSWGAERRNTAGPASASRTPTAEETRRLPPASPSPRQHLPGRWRPEGPCRAGTCWAPCQPAASAPRTSAPAAAPVGNRSAVTGATAAPGEPRACPACPRRRRRVAGTRQAVRSREATAPLCGPSAVPRCLPCWAPAARRGGLR